MAVNELFELIGLLNSKLLWLYFILIVVAFYGILSLLTWNIKKPLMFLGIPFIIIGILLVIIRYTVSIFLPNQSLLAIFEASLKPLLINGIICIILGICMIILYKVLNKIKKGEKISEIENITEENLN